MFVKSLTVIINQLATWHTMHKTRKETTVQQNVDRSQLHKIMIGVVFLSRKYFVKKDSVKKCKSKSLSSILKLAW